MRDGFFGLRNTVFAVEGGNAPVGDGTAIDSNMALGRFSGWDEAQQPSRSLPFSMYDEPFWFPTNRHGNASPLFDVENGGQAPGAPLVARKSSCV